MSVCQHSGYWTNKPINPGSMLVGDRKHKPSNPIVGDMFFDTTKGRALMWDGSKWTVILPTDEQIVVEWEMILEQGFVKIKIFDTYEDRKILVYTEEDVHAQGLDNVLQYIKNNTSEKQYLWAEARIFDHFT